MRIQWNITYLGGAVKGIFAVWYVKSPIWKEVKVVQVLVRVDLWAQYTLRRSIQSGLLMVRATEAADFKDLLAQGMGAQGGRSPNG